MGISWDSWYKFPFDVQVKPRKLVYRVQQWQQCPKQSETTLMRVRSTCNYNFKNYLERATHVALDKS